MFQSANSSQPSHLPSRFPSLGAAVPRTPTTPGNQKFVIVSSQPHANSPIATPSSTSAPTVVKVVAGAPSQAAAAAIPRTPTAQKVVVMTLPSKRDGPQGDSVAPGGLDELGVKSMFAGQATNISLTVKKEPDS